MKSRPEIIGEKVELLGLYRNVSPEQMEAARTQTLKILESAAGEGVHEDVEEAVPVRRVSKRRWIAAAGIAAAGAIAVVVPVIMLRQASAVLEGTTGSRRIEFGEVVRSNGSIGETLLLAEGSRVEMRSESELSLERVDDGVRIHLWNGSIIVNAVKQPVGRHLYVQTKDVIVSVVGTVFLVNAEREGSRVGVIEGEVRVQDAATEKRLSPGDQATTNPTMESAPLKNEVAWSVHAEAHMALLQQATVGLLQQATVAPKPAELPAAFEAVSVRASSSPQVGGRGTTVGPCGPAPQIDPSRFAALNTTVYDLITRAYRLGSCQSVARFELLSGGPGWIESERFDIQAVIPLGSFTDTPGFGDSKLQMMVQDLLATRFNLVLRKELKDNPVYFLTVAKGGHKLPPFKETDERGFRSWLPLPDSKGETMWHFEARGFALQGFSRLIPDMDRPVLDRTGITGRFNFTLEFAPRNGAISYQPGVQTPISSSGPALFTAVEEQLGLRLEYARAPVEVLVIDRAERPSEN